MHSPNFHSRGSHQISISRKVMAFALFLFPMVCTSQSGPAQDYDRLFGISGSGLIVSSSAVSINFRSQTKTNEFSYMQKPSWDATATLAVKNSTQGPMAIVGIDGAYSIGACSPQNAEGINKSISGIGTIDPNYLQPNYPYAVPSASFVQIPPQGQVIIRILLQGCSNETFQGENPDVIVSVSLGSMSRTTRLARMDVTSPSPKLQIGR